MRASSLLLALALGAVASPVAAQSLTFRQVERWAVLPEGRTIGNTTGIEMAADGRSIWVMDRCGGASCAASPLDPIMQFDLDGHLLRSFGGGLMVMPHGMHVDRDGNVWVTDAQGAAGKGHQVLKFSRDGRVLMTLGAAGTPGAGPTTFNRPSDVITGANGDIFVADGHGDASNARIVKFSADGRFIKAWGMKGSGPGEFDLPHALAFDSRGRLWVSDRLNHRLQVFDTNGQFLEAHPEYGAMSAIVIDASDRLYGADSTSTAADGTGFRKGIRIINLRSGRIEQTIPDPQANPTNASGAEGMTVDAKGNLYVTYTDGRGLVKFATEK